MSEEASTAFAVITVTLIIACTILTIRYWDCQQERYMADKGHLYSDARTFPDYVPALQVHP